MLPVASRVQHDIRGERKSPGETFLKMRVWPKKMNFKGLNAECHIASIIHLADRPFMLFSLGGWCVVLFGAPDSHMAQPRSLVGGHLVGAAMGELWPLAWRRNR